MSGFERRGGRNVPKRLTSVAFFGGGVIGLRYADFTSADVEIHSYSIFGGQTILVPPEVNVDLRGVGVMGSFDKSPLPDRRRGGGPWSGQRVFPPSTRADHARRVVLVHPGEVGLGDLDLGDPSECLVPGRGRAPLRCFAFIPDRIMSASPRHDGLPGGGTGASSGVASYATARQIADRTSRGPRFEAHHRLPGN